MASRIKIIHYDSLHKNNSEQWATPLSADLDSDTAVAIDAWARAVVALTTDTYKDTEITTIQSINQKIDEGQG